MTDVSNFNGHQTPPPHERTLTSECNYPLCSKGGERPCVIEGYGEQYVFTLCDDHFEKVRKSGPQILNWLLLLVWS